MLGLTGLGGFYYYEKDWRRPRSRPVEVRWRPDARRNRRKAGRDVARPTRGRAAVLGRANISRAAFRRGDIRKHLRDSALSPGQAITLPIEAKTPHWGRSCFLTIENHYSARSTTRRPPKAPLFEGGSFPGNIIKQFRQTTVKKTAGAPSGVRERRRNAFFA